MANQNKSDKSVTEDKSVANKITDSIEQTSDSQETIAITYINKNNPNTNPNKIITTFTKLANTDTKINPTIPPKNLSLPHPRNKAHSTTPIEYDHYCIEINSIHKTLVEPIIGKMIIGNTLVSYLCDEGADVTIIYEMLLNKIKTSDPKFELTP